MRPDFSRANQEKITALTAWAVDYTDCTSAMG